MYLIFVFSNISCSFQLSLSHLTFSFFTRGKDIDIVKMNNIPKRVSCGRDTCTCVSVCPFRFDFHFGFENKIYCILLLRYLRELLVITIGERPWNKQALQEHNSGRVVVDR